MTFTGFKVGEWVIQTDGDELGDTPLQVLFEDDTMISFDGDIYWADSGFSYWIPKLNEWCWINKRLGKAVSKHKIVYSDGTEEVIYHTNTSIFTGEEVEPFIGELPSWIKDNR